MSAMENLKQVMYGVPGFACMRREDACFVDGVAASRFCAKNLIDGGDVT